MHKYRYYASAFCVALLLAVLPHPAQAQSPLNPGGFGLAPVDLSSSDMGDIDGDGDLDLVVTGRENATLGEQITALYVNNGDGTFSRASEDLSGVGTGSSDFADVDGDGDQDLLITGEEGFSASATLYLNDGSGNFTAANAGLNGVQLGTDAAFGDIDGDGDQDLVIAGSNSSLSPATTLYENDGSGSFTAIDAGIVDLESPSFDFGDVDGDGDQDLVVAGKSSSDPNETTVLYENDGNGNFSETSQGLVDVQGSADLGDTDGDGNLDLVLTGFSAGGSRVARLYENDGNGNFSEAGAGLDPVSGGSVGIADLDGDGNRNLVIAGSDTDNAPTTTIYESQGGGSFSAVGANVTSVVGPLTLGDVEADGDMDLLLTGDDAVFDASTRLYINNTVQSAPNRPPQANRPPSGDTTAAGTDLSTLVEVGDPDGDPVSLQLSQGGSVSGATFTDLGAGIGRFEFTPSRSQSGSTFSFTVGASDGSGQDASFSFSVRVPSAYAAVDAGLGAAFRTASAFGDIDGDGDQDVVITGLDTSETESAVLYERTQGGFSPVGAGLEGVQDGTAAFGDIDGDGDLDLLIAGQAEFGDPSATIYENDGSGNFSATSAGITEVRGDAAAFGDIDNDGDLDLVLAGPDKNLDPTIALYENDGSGSFSKVDAGLTPVKDGSVDFADVDGDGDLDLFVTGSNSGATATLYENDGSGSFSESSGGLPEFDVWQRSDADFGDIDGDGAPDLVLAGDAAFSPDLTVYENDGSGNFTGLSQGLSPVDGGSVQFADVDGDGNLDLIAGGATPDGDASTTIYENDGTGSFSPLGAGLPGIGTESSVSVGYATGDGSLDLLVSGNSSGNRTPTTRFYDNLAASALTASASNAVSSNGKIDFGDTGVDISFSGTSGSGTVTVQKIGNPPSGSPGIAKQNVSTYRFVVGAGGGLSFDSTTALRLDVSTLGGISDASQVSAYRRSIQGEGPFTAVSTTFDSGANELVVSTGRFSEFVLASDTEPLPVEIASFDATVEEGEVRLRWQTASETSNARFDVQRRAGEGKSSTWTTVGSVEGAGTTTKPQRYQYVDTALPFEAEQLTYRLRPVDVDGSASYSREIVVRREAKRLQLLPISPNPIRQRATIRFGIGERAHVSMGLYDMLGRQVRTLVDRTIEGRSTATLSAEGIPSGVYFLQLKAGGQVRTRRLTVVR